MKFLRKFELNNGLDFCQTNRFIMIRCKSSLSKVLKSHGWLETSIKMTTTPMAYDKKAFKLLHSEQGLGLIENQIQLAETMGFKYRTGIGELLFVGIGQR